MTVETRPVFQPYLPRLVVDWRREHPDARFAVVPGSLVSVDISGFTALSERLQAKGRVGAEELILLISGVFEGLIAIAHRHGGDVLKFRGDALLLLFAGDEHEVRACRAASAMQWLDRGDGRDDELRRPGAAADGDGHLLRRLPLLPRRLDASRARRRPAPRRPRLSSSRTRPRAGRCSSAPPRPRRSSRPGSSASGTALRSRPCRRAELGPPVEIDAAEDDLERFIPEPLRRAPRARGRRGRAPHRHGRVPEVLRRRRAARRGGRRGGLPTSSSALGRSVADAAAELGITWLESDIDVDGGKLYLVAGAPTSAGDDEERMLRTLQGDPR